MADASVSAPLGVRGAASKVKRTASILAWSAVVARAIAFVHKYVLLYYRHCDVASFDPYGPRRGWLFLHINAGALALLVGPWQFWTGFGQRNLAILAGLADFSCSEAGLASSGPLAFPQPPHWTGDSSTGSAGRRWLGL